MSTRASPIPADDTQAFEASYERALARAGHELLVALPTGRDATDPWLCKQYTVQITGPAPEDVSCDCAGAVHTGPCKHEACVIFARRNHIRPRRQRIA